MGRGGGAGESEWEGGDIGGRVGIGDKDGLGDNLC